MLVHHSIWVKNHNLLSLNIENTVQKVVGHSERLISSIFASARKSAPCFLLLENLDILVGSRSVDSSGRNPISKRKNIKRSDVGNDNIHDDGESAADGGNEDGIDNNGCTVDGSIVMRSSRTHHKALDRILSTLLVEIDGINDESLVGSQRIGSR